MKRSIRSFGTHHVQKLNNNVVCIDCYKLIFFLDLAVNIELRKMELKANEMNNNNILYIKKNTIHINTNIDVRIYSTENLNKIYRKSLIRPVKQEINSSMSNIIISTFFFFLYKYKPLSVCMPLCRFFYCLLLLLCSVAE